MDRLLTVKDVEQRLQIAHTKLYELLGSGKLRSIKIGRARRIKESDLERFVEDLAAEAETELFG